MRSTVAPAKPSGMYPLFCVLQMIVVLDLERKSTLRCAIIFGPQSHVHVISITPWNVMWTCTDIKPRVFRGAILRAGGPAATPYQRHVRYVLILPPCPKYSRSIESLPGSSNLVTRIGHDLVAETLYVDRFFRG
jgi:hypothetical protein